MNQKEEKWVIFWCDLLSPIIFGEIEEEGTHRFLVETSQTEVVFPDGQVKKPDLSTLKRKLEKFQKGGFKALARKRRGDRGKPRKVATEVIEKAIELKKDQPYRSPETINRFLNALYGATIPRSTLYFHLKNAGATKLKLGITNLKVRKRWTTEHTHDLWIGDFEEGPYVQEGDEILPTYLAAFIDCHSRYVVVARYYLRQNLDILIDALIRALSVHGAPLAIYLDNAKVYHSNGLKSACYRMATRLIYRKEGDPAGGGLIERLFLTVQNQFEAEVRAGEILSLNSLNRSFSAYLAVSYHQSLHSEISKTPEQKYQEGLRVIRKVDLPEVIASFHQRLPRTVNKTFSDVQLNKMLFKVDPRLRGDKVEVRYDPFGNLDTVEIYSLKGEYLGKGLRHQRECGELLSPTPIKGKVQHNYLDLLVQQHEQNLAEKTQGIDYRKVAAQRPWPFHEFVKTIADLLGMKGGLSAFSSMELENLKKTYNQNTNINKSLVKQAFERADKPLLPYILYQLKTLIKQ